MIRNIMLALISAVFLSLLLAFISFTPASNRLPNSYYSSLGDYLLLYLMYSIPVYIVASLLFGYAIKKLNSKFNKNNKYLINIMWYGIFGILTGVIFLICITPQHDFYILSFLTLCIVASFVFYHLSLLLKRLGL